MTIPKFRAWTEEGEVMYYDVYPFKDDTLLLSYDEISFDEVPASDFILMQSTGLKDKNGTEIYEGDIVKYKYDDTNTLAEAVAYDEVLGGFGLVDNDAQGGCIFTFGELSEDIDFTSLEIVGNIYENPELLKGE
ncbi:YopX family protein [Streptococcus lutetiensis]|uniref:YopX family protein n=1 Tax=Streptococcus lutetiensis TaxID=150055 RepID=UPI003563194B